jgi:hypothetical protein
MPKLFTPTRIKNLALPNRFIRSATWEGLATEDGACTPELVDLMEDLAGGNPGLIITGHAYVSPAGQATLRQLGIDNDSRIEGLSEMTLFKFAPCWTERESMRLRSVAERYYPANTYHFVKKSHLNAIKPIFARRPKN